MSWHVETKTPATKLVMDPAPLRKVLLVNDDDDVLQRWMRSATSWVEVFTSRRFVSQTVVQHMDCFPCDNKLELKVHPVASIVAVTYDDTDDINQAFTGFTPRLGPKPSFLYSTDWPSTSRMPGSVQIEMIAGADDIRLIEPEIVQAILMICGHWAENREAYVDAKVHEVPLGVKDILAHHRLWV